MRHHDHDLDPTTLHAPEFWDDRYGSTEALWSGLPNQRLVEDVSGLTPGTALEIGCGEGADAIWLAREGWMVTAVDVSRVALERAARHAAEADPIAAERITWQQQDLPSGRPNPPPTTWSPSTSCTCRAPFACRSTRDWRRRSGPAARC